MQGNRKLTGAVDFDKVLNDYTGWEDGEVMTAPLPGAIPGLKLLMELFTIFILTTREPDAIETWFRKHAPEIPTLIEHTTIALAARHADVSPVAHLVWSDNFERVFWNEDEANGRLLITRRKLPAVFYLDDRAIRFDSWPNAILGIDKHVRAEFGQHSATPYNRNPE
jgi:hypothetical protein